MSAEQEPAFADVPADKRAQLEPILEASFEGRYLAHSKRTLMEIPLVRSASIGGRVVGLTMLKELYAGMGYVYYIAVSPERRGQGIGGKLLDDSLRHFAAVGDSRVYACAEHDNVNSLKLFESRGFRPTSFGEMAREFGGLKTLDIYRGMRAVPGEVVMVRREATPAV